MQNPLEQLSIAAGQIAAQHRSTFPVLSATLDTLSGQLDVAAGDAEEQMHEGLDMDVALTDGLVHAISRGAQVDVSPPQESAPHWIVLGLLVVCILAAIGLWDVIARLIH